MRLVPPRGDDPPGHGWAPGTEQVPGAQVGRPQRRVTVSFAVADVAVPAELVASAR